MSQTFSETIHILSPAKLNLFLHITGKRDNGYHDLQTIFDIIDLSDEMSFCLNDTGEIQLHIDNAVHIEHNIVLKAAMLLMPYRASPHLGCHIQLVKHIPMGAGLGGGSSNAASTLLVLNQLWQCQLNQQQLLDLAQQLGADVPIFIHGKMAWAEGIGEKITPIDLSHIHAPKNHLLAHTSQFYLILKPHCEISTALLFQHAQLKRNYPDYTLLDYLKSPELFENCFEQIVRTHYLPVQNAFQEMQKINIQPEQIRLTGTGSCIFLPLPADLGQQEAHDALAQLKKHTNCPVFLTQRLLSSEVAQRFSP